MNRLDCPSSKTTLRMITNSFLLSVWLLQRQHHVCLFASGSVCSEQVIYYRKWYFSKLSQHCWIKFCRSSVILVRSAHTVLNRLTASFPECHWSKAMSRWWKPRGGEVCHHTHHVHIPCSFRHWWIRLRGEPIVRRDNGTRLHTRREGRTREVCAGGETVFFFFFSMFNCLLYLLHIF